MPPPRAGDLKRSCPRPLQAWAARQQPLSDWRRQSTKAASTPSAAARVCGIVLNVYSSGYSTPEMLTLCCAAKPDSSAPLAALPSHRDDFSRLLAALRAAHPLGEFLDCRVPAKPRCAASGLVLVQPKLTPLLFCISDSPRVPCLPQSNGGELYEHSEWRKRVRVEFAPAQG